MTRKDYILIADALKTVHASVGDRISKEGQSAVHVCAEEIANTLERDNPRFNREHFLAVVRGEKALGSHPVKAVIEKKDECDSCYHLLKETPGKGCDTPSDHYGKVVIGRANVIQHNKRYRHNPKSGGVIMWTDKLQNVYSSFEEFEVYSEMYNLAGRLGFQTAAKAWAENPTIQGSTNPEDYRCTEVQS